MKKFFLKILKFFGKVVVGILILIFLLWVMKQIENAMQPRRYIVTGTAEINLNESESSFDKRFAKELNIEDHQTGLSWKKIYFESTTGEIVLNIGSKPLRFKYPSSLTVSMHDFRKVNKLSMMLNMPFKKKGNHREARDYIYELISMLNERGWKKAISPSYARIKTEETFAYMHDSKMDYLNGLDNNHVLDDKEWLKVSQATWDFYFEDKAFLSLMVHRENGGIEGMKQLSGYLISVEVKTPEHLAYYNFKPHERHRWKELYPALLEKNKIFREESEQKAIEAGYNIDYEYKDSPLNRGIFDLSKYHDEFDEKVTVTKTGYWQSYIASSEPLRGLSKREGAILFYKGGMVFIEKDEELAKYHNLLRWRFLGTKDEYDLSDGKLIKKV